MVSLSAVAGPRSEEAVSGINELLKEERDMAGDLKSNFLHGGTWVRGLFILLFAALYSLAEAVIVVLVLLQFGSHLITGGPIVRLSEFARGLNSYAYQILQFVTYRSEVRPFPLGPWPTQGMDDVIKAEQAEIAARSETTAGPEGGPQPHAESEEKDTPHGA